MGLFPEPPPTLPVSESQLRPMVPEWLLDMALVDALQSWSGQWGGSSRDHFIIWNRVAPGGERGGRESEISGDVSVVNGLKDKEVKKASEFLLKSLLKLQKGVSS